MNRFNFVDIDTGSKDEIYNLKLDASKRDLQEALNLLKSVEHRHKNQHSDEEHIFEDDLLKIILDLQELEIGVGYRYKK